MAERVSGFLLSAKRQPRPQAVAMLLVNRQVRVAPAAPRAPRRRGEKTCGVTVPALSRPLRAGLLVNPKAPGVRERLSAPFSTRQARHGHGGDHRGDSGGFATRFKGLTCSPTSPQRLLLTTRRFRFRGGHAARPHDDLGCELLALRVPRRQLKATLGRPGAYDGRGLPVYVYPVTRRCHAARVRVGPPAS